MKYYMTEIRLGRELMVALREAELAGASFPTNVKKAMEK